MPPAERRPGEAVTPVRTRRVALWLAAVVLALVAMAAVVSTGPSSGATVTADGATVDRWIVVVAPGHEAAVVNELLGDAVAASLATDERRIQDGVWVLDQAAGRRAAALDGVIEARPEQRFVASVVPNDPCLVSCLDVHSTPRQQWHHTNIKSEAAWDVSVGDGSVVVAVLDSGIRDTHLDLAGRVARVGGCGLTPLTPSQVQQTADHGTHVAGLIGAATNNATGVAGVAWNVQILDVRVLTGGGGFESDIISGIICATDAGADVLNLSLQAAASQPSVPLANAVQYALDRGVIVIAASGNEGQTPGVPVTSPVYPAGLDGVIAVTSTDQSNSLSSFAHRGAWADIAAPGENVLSLSAQSDFAVFADDGTSFSAPLVAGAVALVEAQFPSFSSDQLMRRILWTSAPYAAPGVSSEFGLLDLEAALTEPRRHTWQVTDQGEIIALGDAPHLGDAVALGAQAAALSAPIVGMAVTPSGNGYWLVASDGGIFAYGDAVFHGSTGNISLNQPIVGMAVTPSGNGYWLVASDGGIFAFGLAPYLGSTGAIALNQPIATMVSGPEGYSLIAEDGGMFNYGPRYLGSGANVSHNGTVVGAASWVEGA